MLVYKVYSLLATASRTLAPLDYQIISLCSDNCIQRFVNKCTFHQTSDRLSEWLLTYCLTGCLMKRVLIHKPLNTCMSDCYKYQFLTLYPRAAKV